MAEQAHVPLEHKEAVAADLKRIYHAPDEETAYQNLQKVKKNLDKDYPDSMNHWEENWDAIRPIFKYSAPVRETLYNAIESLIIQYRRIYKGFRNFPSEDAMKRVLVAAPLQIIKKFPVKIRNWEQIYGEISAVFMGRL